MESRNLYRLHSCRFSNTWLKSFADVVMKEHGLQKLEGEFNICCLKVISSIRLKDIYPIHIRFGVT